MDELAGSANVQQDPAFRELWDDVCKDLTFQTMKARATLQVHANVASAAVRLGRGQGLECPDAFLPTAADEVEFPHVVDKHVPRLWAKYGRRYVEAVYT